jgi:type I restriction enzyme R subunit
MEIVREGFGSKKDYQQAISDLEDEIYWVPPPKQA